MLFCGGGDFDEGAAEIAENGRVDAEGCGGLGVDGDDAAGTISYSGTVPVCSTSSARSAVAAPSSS